MKVFFLSRKYFYFDSISLNQGEFSYKYKGEEKIFISIA